MVVRMQPTNMVDARGASYAECPGAGVFLLIQLYRCNRYRPTTAPSSTIQPDPPLLARLPELGGGLGLVVPGVYLLQGAPCKAFIVNCVVQAQAVTRAQPELRRNRPTSRPLINHPA